MAKSKQKKTVASKSHKKAAGKVHRAAKPAPKAARSTPRSAPRNTPRNTPKSTPKTPARVELKAKAIAKVVKSSGKNGKPGVPERAERPERGQIVPASVPTNVKPRKNLAGLSPKDLEFFRSLLLAKRRELVGDMSSMEHEALTTGSNLSNLPVHMADMGTDNYEQEFTLGLVEKDRVLLREINSALAKVQDGTYGLCEGTGKPITKARLEAKPWAKHSIEYARKLERGFGR